MGSPCREPVPGRRASGLQVATYAVQPPSRPDSHVWDVATPGIVCHDSYVAPHGAGMGDHRLYIHDFCARSVLGVEYPKLVRAGSRKLHCKVERTVKSYNRVLKQLLIRHRASDKMFSLGKNHEDMSASEFQLELKRWDQEVTNLKRAAESCCNQMGPLNTRRGLASGSIGSVCTDGCGNSNRNWCRTRGISFANADTTSSRNPGILLPMRSQPGLSTAWRI